MKKKLISISMVFMLTVIMLFAFVATSFAADLKVGDKFGVNHIGYEVTSIDPYKTVSIVSNSLDVYIDLNLSEVTYNGETFTVTAVDKEAFSGFSGITSVNLPYVEKVGRAAFIGCSNLVSVNLPKATDISEGAFYKCTKLTTATIPKCKSLADYAFYYCKSLTSLNIPYIEDIGKETFNSCVNFHTIYISQVPPRIAASAFTNCPEERTLYCVDENGKYLDTSNYGEEWLGWTVSQFKSNENANADQGYDITKMSTDNGSFSISANQAKAGVLITITASPDNGYAVEKVNVVDGDGYAVNVSKSGDNTYTFVQQKNGVKVNVTFYKTASTWGNPFNDVKDGDWFYNDVEFVCTNKYMNGSDASSFAPNASTDRAMVVTILYRLADSPRGNTTFVFWDVTNSDWFGEPVAWASTNEIVKGYDDQSFKPYKLVTREELAVMLYRYAQYKGMATVVAQDNLAQYVDKNKISNFATDAVNWAVARGILGGNPDGTLNPQGTASRAELAAMIHRFTKLNS